MFSERPFLIVFIQEEDQFSAANRKVRLKHNNIRTF